MFMFDGPMLKSSGILSVNMCMRIVIKIKKIEIITYYTKGLSLYDLHVFFLSIAEIFFMSEDDVLCYIFINN